MIVTETEVNSTRYDILITIISTILIAFFVLLFIFTLAILVLPRKKRKFDKNKHRSFVNSVHSDNRTRLNSPEEEINIHKIDSKYSLPGLRLLEVQPMKVPWQDRNEVGSGSPPVAGGDQGITLESLIKRNSERLYTLGVRV